MHKRLRVIILIGITITLLTPVYLVVADDTKSPIISNISYRPHAGVMTDPGFSLFQSCNVTDNVSVSEVRINITGPAGFVPINTSMNQTSSDGYSYELFNITLAGTYWFYIWAKDSSNNTAQSGTYHMLVFDNYLTYIYVDANNTAGPWDGTAQNPLQYIEDAVSVLATNGTIFINEGLYQNISLTLEKNVNFIGENRDTTILDGGGGTNSNVITVSANHSIHLTNLTVRHAVNGLQIQNSNNSSIVHCSFTLFSDSAIKILYSQNLLVSSCDIRDNTRGIYLMNSSNNQFYHNNFLNNTIHVSISSDTSSNTWDNGVTGNYWDDYRILYPDATVIPSTGTWDIAYVVNGTGDNTDYHPWVYPSGFIDTVPPEVLVLYPNGGEVVEEIITIQWSASDDYTMDLNGSILIEYSSDNGNNWNILADNQNNTGAYEWNTSTVPDGNQYLIGISTVDEFFNIGSDTSNSPFTILNNWDEPPESIQISGPVIGANYMPYNFTVIANDPQGQQIYYQWDWGDGNYTDWIGPFDSGVPLTTSYLWVSDGVYNITARARDIEGTVGNWSAPHMISIQPLVNFSNINLGYIYFKLFSFNQSYIYSNFLERLGVVIMLTTHELEVESWAADIVQSVTFRAEHQTEYETIEITDDDPSDGFSCVFNVSRGFYEMNVTAYDGNGTLVDKYSLPAFWFIRIGKYANGPPQETSRLQFPRLRH